MKNNDDYILVVDDSQTNNVLLEAVLVEAGYRVQTVMSATEAWNLLYQKRPMLILLDLLMPKISGFQLLERMKNKVEYGNIPVIVVSALNNPDTAKMVMDIGASDFFAKPLSIQKLLERIKELIED